MLWSLLCCLLRTDGKTMQFFYAKETQQYWQQCEAGLEYVGNNCRGNPLMLSWQQALRYCADLPGNWRLAKRDELFGFYMRFGRAQLHFVNLYWTSSTDSERPELAWYLIPELRWLYTNYKELDGLVLCLADEF